jgi:uncharacterized alkaline shock family protein YloU
VFVLFYESETPEGSVFISKNVIGKIVVQSVKRLNDKVMISNHRGKLPGAVRSKISGGDVINNVDIAISTSRLDIKIYVVMHFGMSIGNTTNSIIEEVYSRIREFIGIEPNSIAIIVTGMISKHQVMRRNIEVKR